MKAIKSYSQSFSIGFKSLKLNTLIYIVFLAIALLLVIPFYRMFVSVTEYNADAGILLEGFSATVLGDILRANGKMFLVYIKGLWPWMLAFWMLGIYFYGAIVSWVAGPRGKFKLTNAISSANKLFWPYFKLSIYILVIQAIFAILVYLIPVIMVSQENLTDAYIVRTISIGIIIHLFFFTSIGMMADIARFELFRVARKKVIRHLWRSIKFVIARFGSFWIMFLLWAILPVATILAFIVFRNQITVNSSLTILVVFAIQQLFIWLRFLFRIQKQGMLFSFYMIKQVAD